jgi:hypothetical protein
MPMPPRPLTPDRSPSHRLGAALRTYRSGKFSQLGLAKKVHVSTSLIAMIERGERIGAQQVMQDCDSLLGAQGALSALWDEAEASRSGVGRPARSCAVCHHPGTADEADEQESRIPGVAGLARCRRAKDDHCCERTGGSAVPGSSGPASHGHRAVVSRVLDRVEQALTVVLDRECLVRGHASVGARTDRGTWVRIASRSAELLGEHGWNGAETAAALSDVARPDWYGSVTWRDEVGQVVWRADEIALVESRAVEPAGFLTRDPGLSPGWWRAFGASLDALAGYRTARIAVSQGVAVTQEQVTGVIEDRWPGRVDTRVEDWACAHGAMTWAKVTSPVCWVLGWHDWGLAPRGLDAATLWACSLTVPEVAGRIWRERRADLDSHTGRIMALYCLARVMERAPAAGELFQSRARQEAARLLDQPVCRAA